MILFPEITSEAWIEKHPYLKVVSTNCKNCGNKLSSTIPFKSKGYIGLTTPICSCGNKMSKAECAIPRTKEEQDSWNQALGE